MLVEDDILRYGSGIHCRPLRLDRCYIMGPVVEWCRWFPAPRRRNTDIFRPNITLWDRLLRWNRIHRPRHRLWLYGYLQIKSFRTK